MAESEETFLGCIPLRTGVWVIAILQAINSGIRLIPGVDIPGMDQYDGVYYYIYIMANSISLFAAALLMLGLSTNNYSYFRPWIVLTLLGPLYFLLHLLLNIFTFNLFGASRVFLYEGLAAMITLYCVNSVYTLYKILIMEEASIPVTVDHGNAINTVYGTNGLVVVTTDPANMTREDLPPSYEELAATHKEHIRY